MICCLSFRLFFTLALLPPPFILLLLSLSSKALLTCFYLQKRLISDSTWCLAGRGQNTSALLFISFFFNVKF